MNRESIVGQIAIEIPGATRVFRKHRIDFCCGGQKSMADSCGEKLPVILEELQALSNSTGNSPTLKQVKSRDLIQHLINDYHEKHRVDLPEAIIMARRVESVHADKSDCPHGLADLLLNMSQEMESHMLKEERVLFPAILENADAGWLINPIMGMRSDHEDLGRDIEKIEKITNNFTPPAEACNTWRALYLLVQTFTNELMEHVSLENNVLFPRALSEGVK